MLIKFLKQMVRLTYFILNISKYNKYLFLCILPFSLEGCISSLLQ